MPLTVLACPITWALTLNVCQHVKVYREEIGKETKVGGKEEGRKEEEKEGDKRDDGEMVRRG